MGQAPKVTVELRQTVPANPPDDEKGVAIRRSSPDYAAMQQEMARVIFKAIVEREALTAVYNGQTIELHPHQIFVRHDAMFVRAVNPNKGRRHDEAPSLGEFKLNGLRDLAAAGKAFDPLEGFTGAEERDGEQVLLAVIPA
jgi:hypothetical protein